MTSARITGILLAVLLALTASAVLVGSAGAKQEKVEICHKGKTISVATPAVAAHERHGDTVGACGTETPLEESGGIDLAGLDAETIESTGDKLIDALRFPDLADDTCTIAADATITIRSTSGDFAGQSFTIINGENSAVIQHDTTEGLSATTTVSALIVVDESGVARGLGTNNSLEIVGTTGITCVEQQQEAETALAGTLRETTDGAAALKTERGETIKVKGATKKIDKALKDAASKSPKAELKGRRAGDTLTVSTGNAKKKR